MSNERELNRGQSYFLLGYYDRQFRFPYIQTYVFLGKNLPEFGSHNEEDLWFFQNPKYFLERGVGASNEEREEKGIVVATRKTLDAYVDQHGLIEALAKGNS